MASRERTRELLIKGARVEYAELEAQLHELRAEFPELATSNGHSNGNGHRVIAAAPSGVVGPVRRRRKMSKKARLAISAAQKLRWSKHKKAQAAAAR
jgi:hypothetical protein